MRSALVLLVAAIVALPSVAFAQPSLPPVQQQYAGGSLTPLLGENVLAPLGGSCNASTGVCTIAITGTVSGATGGLGVAQPTCTATQRLTCNGTACSCVETTVFKATDYGALCNNTADDTTAIRAALAAAASGGVVELPCGTCRVTKSAENGALKINVPNVTLRGTSRACSILKFVDNTTDLSLIAIGSDGASPDSSGFVLERLTLDGNAANYGASGHHYGLFRGTQGTANHVVVRDVTFQNFGSATETSSAIFANRSWTDWTIEDSLFAATRIGVNLNCNAAGSACADLHVARNLFDQTGAGGSALGDAGVVVTAPTSTSDGWMTGIVLAGNQCDGTCNGNCLKVVSGSNVTMTGNVADGCLADQIVASQSASAATAHNVTMIGNVARNGNDGGFGFETASGEVGPRSVSFTGNVAEHNGSVGLFLVTTQDALVAGNVFDGNGQNVEKCVAGTNAHAACTVSSECPGSSCLTAAGAGGVYLVGEATTYTARNNQLANNQYIDTQGSPTQPYGINIPNSLVDGTVIEGGVFANNVTAPFAIANAAAVSNTRVTYAGGVTAADLAASFNRAIDGSMAYCSDCVRGSNPCRGSGSGANAERIGGVWHCDRVQETPTPSGPTPTSTSCPSGQALDQAVPQHCVAVQTPATPVPTWTPQPLPTLKACMGGTNTGVACANTTECPSGTCVSVVTRLSDKAAGTPAWLDTRLQMQRGGVGTARCDAISVATELSLSDGLYCRGGSNAGVACTVDSQCPSSTCDWSRCDVGATGNGLMTTSTTALTSQMPTILKGDSSLACVGNASDFCFEYDATNKKFTLLTSKNIANTINDPLVDIQYGSSIAAGQLLFRLYADGSSALQVAKGGSLTLAGNLTCGGIAGCTLSGAGGLAAGATFTVQSTANATKGTVVSVAGDTWDLTASVLKAHTLTSTDSTPVMVGATRTPVPTATAATPTPTVAPTMTGATMTPASPSPTATSVAATPTPLPHALLDGVVPDCPDEGSAGAPAPVLYFIQGVSLNVQQAIWSVHDTDVWIGRLCSTVWMDAWQGQIDLYLETGSSCYPTSQGGATNCTGTRQPLALQFNATLAFTDQRPKCNTVDWVLVPALTPYHIVGKNNGWAPASGNAWVSPTWRVCTASGKP